MLENIIIAKILSTHGVKGYVKIESYMDKSKDIFLYNQKLYDINENKIQIEFVGLLKNNIFITKINDITDTNIAKNYINTELYININLLPKLNNNEFYYNSLIGLQVKSEENKFEGIVLAVNDFGAGTIVEIKWKDEKMEESIPFVEEYVKEINIDKGYLIIKRPIYI